MPNMPVTISPPILLSVLPFDARSSVGLTARQAMPPGSRASKPSLENIAAAPSATARSKRCCWVASQESGASRTFIGHRRTLLPSRHHLSGKPPTLRACLVRGPSHAGNFNIDWQIRPIQRARCFPLPHTRIELGRSDPRLDRKTGYIGTISIDVSHQAKRGDRRWFAFSQHL